MVLSAELRGSRSSLPVSVPAQSCWEQLAVLGFCRDLPLCWWSPDLWALRSPWQLLLLVLEGVCVHPCPPGWLSRSCGGTSVCHTPVRMWCHLFAWSLRWLVLWAANVWGPRWEAAPALATSDAKCPTSKRAASRSGDHVPRAGCSWGRTWEGIAGYQHVVPLVPLCQEPANGLHRDVPLWAGACLLHASCIVSSAAVAFLRAPSLRLLHKGPWSELMMAMGEIIPAFRTTASIFAFKVQTQEVIPPRTNPECVNGATVLAGVGCCILAGRFEALQVTTAAENLPGKSPALAAGLGSCGGSCCVLSWGGGRLVQGVTWGKTTQMKGE